MIDSSEIKVLQAEIRLELGRSRIRRLSPHQQKVLQVVHEHPELCNQEIARYCFITENSISVTLNDLLNLGILNKIKQVGEGDKRKSLWHICDQQIRDAMAINDRNTETLRGQDGKL